tara:strand:- start:2000 stop:2278 length:279 start_codon:yes stop_codon:yes gene_type:complete
MSLIVLDPTGEMQPAQRALLTRPERLEGLTIGILDISKTKGDIFLNRIDELLQLEGLETKRYIKPTFSRPAPVELKQKIVRECDVVIEGLAD